VIAHDDDGWASDPESPHGTPAVGHGQIDDQLDQKGVESSPADDNPALGGRGGSTEGNMMGWGQQRVTCSLLK
jgi:hypothetical protein